jgi:DNA (cytosine-5)-methyltransferase 1
VPFSAVADDDAAVSASVETHKYDVRMSPAKARYYLERARARPSFVRFVDPDAPLATLRAGYLKSRGAEALVLSDASGKLLAAPARSCRMRMLTVEEAARAQSFPSGYRFLGAAGHKFKHIGNAVPPRLAQALGGELIAVLE